MNNETASVKMIVNSRKQPALRLFNKGSSFFSKVFQSIIFIFPCNETAMKNNMIRTWLKTASVKRIVNTVLTITFDIFPNMATR